MSDKKEKILKGCNGIPVQSLLKYINLGEVTLPELREAGLAPEKARALIQMRRDLEQAAWDAACKEGTAEAYQLYLQQNPTGLHSDEARNELVAYDEQAWLGAQSSMNEETLKAYLSNFPDGIHAQECGDLLADLPWLQAKQQNTLQAYQTYRDTYPGKHQQEVDNAISTLSDDIDWQNACSAATTVAYQGYIDLHPLGRHTAEASQRVAAAAHREEFLNELRADPNAYGAKEIQQTVENNGASWDDIARVFGPTQADSIRQYTRPADLPSSMPPPALDKNSTEVYFWGTPSSGKTCALGSIVSSVRNQGIYSPEKCAGFDYMTRLSNIFDQAGYCVFPESTAIGNIQEMRMTLKDDKRRDHHVTLIDLAGELFRSAYFKQNNLFLQASAEQTLDTALAYLNDSSNKKIHFFVVEYGAHSKQWEGLRMADYLDNMVLYLRDQGVFRKSTVGVYVLVTKCDKIPCAPEDRPQKAYEYVTQTLLSFYNTLQDVCKRAGVDDLTVLAFSVGEVFAQNLCVFDGTDTDKVVNKLLMKTPASSGKFGWLRN